MKNLKKYLPLILLFVFVALAIIIAIGVSRRGPIAPTAPESRPAAAVCSLSFSIAASACNGTCTVDSECGTGMICHKENDTDTSGLCRNPSCLSSADCLCPTPVPGQAGCVNKVAYRDVAENAPGSYQLTSANTIGTNDRVNPGDKIVFYMSGSPVASTTSAKVVWQDVLNDKFTFLDGDSCVTYNSATRTVTCDQGLVSPGENYNFAIRVQVNTNATGESISNIAELTSGSASGSATIANSCSTAVLLSTATPTPTPTPGPMGGFFIRKYRDSNGNGTQETSETGLTWKFQWSQDNGISWNDYETDGNKLGEGTVISLPVGTPVDVREIAADGWTATTPTNVEITIKANDNQLLVFGNWQPTSSTPTPTPTATPAARCNSACVTSSDCPTSMNCISGFCRNPSCSDATNCVCATVAPTPTPTPEELPKSGVIDDTLKLVGAGIGAIILGLIALLAL